MYKHDVVLIAALTAVLGAPSLEAQQGAPPPAAAKKAHPTEIHGYTLKDDYFWLREKSNTEVTSTSKPRTLTPTR